MQVYTYNVVTNEFAGEVLLALDHEETTRQGVAVYLWPPNAVQDAPPDYGDQEIPVWSGTAWTVQPDFRGEAIYDARGTVQIVTDIGPIPDGWSLETTKTGTPQTYYTFNPLTGELVGDGRTTVDGSIAYQLRSTTTIAPPQAGANQIPVFDGQVWKLVSDYREQTVYSIVDGSSMDIEQLGELPEGYTLSVPPAFTKGQAAEYDGSAWTVLEDHRGTRIYGAEGGSHVPTQLGPIPDGWLASEPPVITEDEMLEIENGAWVKKTKPLADRVNTVLAQRQRRYEQESDPILLESLMEKAQGHSAVATTLEQKALTTYAAIKTDLPKPTV